MAELSGLVVDLDLCVGCYACEVACKQEHNVPTGRRWIRVVPVGPQELNGKPQLDFLPITTDGCNLCNKRLRRDLKPRCVDNCPTEALIFYKSAAELLALLQSGRRLQVCKVKSEVPAFV